MALREKLSRTVCFDHFGKVVGWAADGHVVLVEELFALQCGLESALIASKGGQGHDSQGMVAKSTYKASSRTKSSFTLRSSGSAGAVRRRDSGQGSVGMI